MSFLKLFLEYAPFFCSQKACLCLFQHVNGGTLVLMTLNTCCCTMRTHCSLSSVYYSSIRPSIHRGPFEGHEQWRSLYNIHFYNYTKLYFQATHQHSVVPVILFFFSFCLIRSIDNRPLYELTEGEPNDLRSRNAAKCH